MYEDNDYCFSLFWLIKLFVLRSFRLNKSCRPITVCDVFYFTDLNTYSGPWLFVVNRHVFVQRHRIRFEYVCIEIYYIEITLYTFTKNSTYMFYWVGWSWYYLNFALFCVDECRGNISLLPSRLKIYIRKRRWSSL